MKIRATEPRDVSIIQKWIDSDPEHSGRADTKLFTEKTDGLTQFVVLDKHEKPLFFVTLEKVVRGHIQFAPETGPAAMMRNARALCWLAGFLKHGLPKLKVREFITESSCRPLISFLERAFGLRKTNNDYSVRVGA